MMRSIIFALLLAVSVTAVKESKIEKKGQWLAVRDGEEISVGCAYHWWNMCIGDAVQIVSNTVGGYSIYTHVGWAVWYNWDAITGVWWNCASATAITSDSCTASTITALQGLIDYGGFRAAVTQRATEIMSVVRTSWSKGSEVARLLHGLTINSVAKSWLRSKYNNKDWTLGYGDLSKVRQIFSSNVMALVASLKDLVGWNDISLANTAVGVGYGVGGNAVLGVGFGMDVWTNHPDWGYTASWGTAASAYFWDYTGWKWTCCKKKYSYSVTPQANIGAGVKGAADISVGLSLVSPENVGGYGAAVAFGVAHGGGFQLEVGFAFDTTLDRVYVASVTVAAAGGVEYQLGQISYGYTQVVLDQTTYPDGTNPGLDGEASVGEPRELPPTCSEDNPCVNGCREGCSHPGSRDDHCILDCVDQESSLAARNKELKHQNKLLREELTKLKQN